MGIFSCIQYLICIIRICQKLKYKVKYLHGKKSCYMLRKIMLQSNQELMSGDHFIMYINTELPYCIPETNKILYVNYSSILKN